MKFLLLFLPFFTFAQGDQTIIQVPIGNGQTEAAILHLPDDYSKTTGNYPFMVFLHGRGESSTNPATIYSSAMAGGPSYFIAQGKFPATFVNPADGQPYKFIILSPQNSTGWSTSASQLDYIIKYMLANYRINVNRIYLTGLSAGGQGIMDYTTKNGNVPSYIPAAIVPMSAATSQPVQGWANIVVKDSVHVWAFGSVGQDTFGDYASIFVNLINSIKAAYAKMTNYNGGHCCWNTFYNPTYKPNGINIYEWMLQFDRGRTVLPLPVPSTPTLVQQITIQLMSDGTIRLKN